MKAYELFEYGRIVKGVNTTVDVGPNEIPKQARKFGFKVDKGGRPPTLSKKVKGKKTNVLFNLGLAESISEEKSSVKNFINNDLKLLDKLFSKNGFEIRIVGGAVRDVALGKTPKDIDLATDATPDEMQDMLTKANIKHKPTGIEHGTITAIINKEPYEITTLRADVDTDGRHAEVEFVKNWEEDAKRRDLTYNAMSMSFDGEIFDYFGGMNDLQNKVSKFVGDPEQRIQEDYLRILRYFRFQGRLNQPNFEENTLQAIKKNTRGLSKISVERIWTEMDKILSGQNITEILDHMQKTGVLNAIGLSVDNLEKVIDNEDSLINLARIVKDDSIGVKWKLSKVEQSTLLTLVKNKDKELKKDIAEKLIASGKNKYILAKLATMQGNKDLASYIEKFNAPEFPVSGNDLIAMGQKSGPELGQKLNYLKQKWMQSNFTATKDELLRSLSESKKNLNEAIHLWPLIVAAFTAIAKKKGPKQAKAIMSEFIRRLPPGAGVSEIVDLIKLVGGAATGALAGKAILKTKDDVEEATVDEIAKSSEIYVDMDGVLADFFGDWKKLVGKDWRKIKDIGPALQKIRDTDDFWLKLPMTNNAKNLLNLIKGIKGSYKILSSPLPDDPNSEPHKRKWVESNLNFFPPEDVIITFDKTKFATQSDGTPNILIDDYGVNIQKWESAGGVGFKHKDHKFERTARNIQAHMTQPVRKENYQRSQLPQIKSYDLQYIDHEFMLLPIQKIVPVQKERVMENFKKQVDRILIGQYNPIVVDNSNKIVNGHHRYDALKLLGEKYIQVAKIPYSIKYIIENFADGKKKGRKGLAKRSGVNCKQSISKLRKIAKNSTGERRRMAHWCANMKSGRKK